MKIKKGIIIAVLTLLLLGGIGVFLFFQKKQPSPAQVFIPEPAIPIYTSGDWPLTVTIQKRDFVFPDSLPLLELTTASTYTEEELKTIASKIKIAGEPKVVNDVFDGRTYIWGSDNYSLVAYPNSKRIEISLSPKAGSVPNKQLSDKEVELAAKGFLKEAGLIDTQESVDPSFVSYYEAGISPETSVQTTRDKAYFYRVNFVPSGISEKILTLNPQTSPINVTVLRDGTVTGVHFIRIGKLSKSLTNYKIKNYDQFRTDINKIKLASVNDGNSSVTDFTPNSFSKIELIEIKIAYLWDSSSPKYLQPVFVLTGTATLANSTSLVNVTFYLQAINSL